jgi:stearoyl-CoA desaturase (Delta-9 desaturase)
MPVYNVVGYSVITLYLLAAGVAAPLQWGFAAGAVGGFLYLVLLWLIAGLYIPNVLHLGLAHRALDFRRWFINFTMLLNNTVGVYVDPTSWVDRHRHHHAFSDGPGDPNKRAEDGFWKTMYLCLFPYDCPSNLAGDAIFKTRVFRLVSSTPFAVFSQSASYVLLWLVVGNWTYALVLWSGVRVTALWVNMIQNYWTHDRRFGTRRYLDDSDNAMNIGEWLPVTATFGACLQNNHHHSEGFLRTSHDPAEYDFGFLTVRAMKALGLVRATASGARKPEGIALQEIGL